MMDENYCIIHGGPGSGRYPLGSGGRPYQKFEKSKRKSSGISGYISSIKAKKAEEERLKQKDKEKQLQEEQEKERRRKEADKERVLREGSAIEVMKYQGELTNQQLQNVYTRLNLESQIRRLSENEIKSTVDKIDKIMKTVKTGTEWVRIGTDAYNSIAAIYNTTSDGKKKPLAIVGKDGGDKKNK